MNKMEELNIQEMRQQMDILKSKLEKQEIISEQMVRRSMKSKMSWIKKYLILAIFAIPFVALCMLPMVIQMHVSWWWYAFTIVMITADVAADWYINTISGDAFLKGNLKETAEKLVRMKRLRRLSTLIGITVVILWLVWLTIELWYAHLHAVPGTNEAFAAYGYMFGAGIGALIGLPLGLYIYFRMQRTNDEILEQIGDLIEE